MQIDDRVVAPIRVQPGERLGDSVRPRGVIGPRQNGAPAGRLHRGDDRGIVGGDDHGTDVGLPRPPPDMNNHRRAVDVGERFQRQPGRGQARGNEDDGTQFEAAWALGKALIRVAKPRAKRLISATEASNGGRGTWSFDDVSSAGITTTDANKTALAIMAVLLLTMGLGVFSNALYAPDVAEKPGYPLPSGVAKTATAAGPAETPLPVLLAKADEKKGEADTKVCQSCHNFEKGGAAKVGPPLYGVVGRPKGSVPGFAYSDGMKAMGGIWTYEDLYKFLTKPSAYVSGTKMTYPGEPDDQKRADIEAYLQKDEDTPVPFPKEAAPAAAPAAKAAPAAAPAPVKK